MLSVGPVRDELLDPWVPLKVEYGPLALQLGSSDLDAMGVEEGGQVDVPGRVSSHVLCPFTPRWRSRNVSSTKRHARDVRYRHVGHMTVSSPACLNWVVSRSAVHSECEHRSLLLLTTGM